MTLLFFPRLQANLLGHQPPPGVKFVNPGLKIPGTGGDCWRPGGLVLDEHQAERYIQESLGFGEQFTSPADLAYFARASCNDFYANTSAAIRSEFSRSLRTAKGGMEREQIDPHLKGQMILLLVWTFEKKIHEFCSIHDKNLDLGHRLQTSLGLDEEKPPAFPLDPHSTRERPQDEVLPWSKVLPWFLLFMTATDRLFVRDRQIIADWLEAGVAFSPLEPGESAEMGLDPEKNPGLGLHKGQALGLQLALLQARSTDMPWLEQEYQLIICDRYQDRKP